MPSLRPPSQTRSEGILPSCIPHDLKDLKILKLLPLPPSHIYAHQRGQDALSPTIVSNKGRGHPALVQKNTHKKIPINQ